MLPKSTLLKKNKHDIIYKYSITNHTIIIQENKHKQEN